jgi:subtilisin family serine protease
MLFLILFSIIAFASAINETLINSTNETDNVSLDNFTYNQSDIVNNSSPYILNESALIQDNNSLIQIESNVSDELIVPSLINRLNGTEKLKVHPSILENITEKNSKVLIQLKNKDSISRIKQKIKKSKSSTDNTLIFAEVNSSHIESLVKEADVEKIWPDLQTHTVINSSSFQIGADYLWDVNFSGSGIKIAILDTGIDSDHEMLDGRVVQQVDFTDSGSADDEYGHGTHCAGIAAGNGYYKGIAYNASIYNGKVLDDNGYGQLSWLINGLDWAIDLEVDIISLSLGALYSGEPEEQLSSPEVLKIEEAIANGIVVVVASGNCGSGYCGDFDSVTTPGIARNAITVGAVDSDSNWASFSSGDEISDYIKPDVVAPGVDICSSAPDGYDCWSGTSMATPHVAGAAGLLLSWNQSLSPGNIKQMLESSSVDLGDSGKDVQYGSGLIDLSNIFNTSVELENKSYQLIAYDLNAGDKEEIIFKYKNEDEKPRRIEVEIVIHDLNGDYIDSDESVIPSEKTRDFSFSWTPMVAGKYIVDINIYELDKSKKKSTRELIEFVDELIYVSGMQKETMESVRLVLR